jgi:hypothetical protein
MDRGANGGILGNDARTMYTCAKLMLLVSITMNSSALKLVDAASKIITHKGPAIGIFRQYAYHGHNRSIHSSGQFRGLEQG